MNVYVATYLANHYRKTTRNGMLQMSITKRDDLGFENILAVTQKELMILSNANKSAEMSS